MMALIFVYFLLSKQLARNLPGMGPKKKSTFNWTKMIWTKSSSSTFEAYPLLLGGSTNITILRCPVKLP